MAEVKDTEMAKRRALDDTPNEGSSRVRSESEII